MVHDLRKSDEDGIANERLYNKERMKDSKHVYEEERVRVKMSYRYPAEGSRPSQERSVWGCFRHRT